MSDSRLTLARPDLADLNLQGLVAANRYAASTLRRVATPSAALLEAPGGGLADQLLFGELFRALEVQNGLAWGQATRDGRVGFVAAADLAAPGAPATHRVAVPRTYAFARPDIKTPAVGPYSLNALTAIEALEGRFAKGEGTGWFIAAHLAPIGVAQDDYVAVAEGFLGAPYRPGGRETLGVDAQGLVQQALAACGRAVPRDVDAQADTFTSIAEDGRRRGDLAFWKDHVAVLLDAETVLHASRSAMAVTIEPLADVRMRLGAVTGWRRP